MRKYLLWFLVGAAVVAFSATTWELLGFRGFGEIAMVALIVFAPAYFAVAWSTMLGAALTYLFAAALNGSLYAFLAWIVTKLPDDRKWLKASIVLLPFLPIWVLFTYAEFFSH